MSLSATDKTRLFQVARDSIRACLEGKSPQPLKDLPPQLLEPRGVFVTLHRQKRLRGCIGYLEAVKALAPAVQEMAVCAAFSDPRFRPLEANELDDLEIEISILTPMRRIENVEEVEVGRDGLYIEQGACRGLLLPQVATECRWDRQTFLEQTCCKAGLPPDAWKDKDTRIYVFTAEILSEGPAKPGCARQESK
jgi:AmmeMemoRadiSam system protein A